MRQRNLKKCWEGSIVNLAFEVEFAEIPMRANRNQENFWPRSRLRIEYSQQAAQRWALVYRAISGVCVR
jgi:hypothetical protein